MMVTFKKISPYLVKLVLTLLIMSLVLSSVPLADYRRVYRLFSLEPLLFISLLTFAQINLLALRWYWLAKAAGSRLPMHYSLYGILISFFFSQGLPATIGGDAFRLWWHRREGIATSTAFKIIFFDRIYGLLSLIILSFLSLFLLAQMLGGQEKIVLLIALAIIAGGMLGILIMPWRLGFSKILHSFSHYFPSFIKKLIDWMLTARANLREQNSVMRLGLLGLGAVTHLLVAVQVWVVGYYLSPDLLNLKMCIAAVPPALFISYMPFSIAGWGVREASMVVSFAMLGVAAPMVILISLAIGMSILAFSLLGGVLWMVGGYRASYAANH